MSRYINDDPGMPWNGPHRNDPSKPWNHPAYGSDPSAPWNRPSASEYGIREYEERRNIRIKNY